MRIFCYGALDHKDNHLGIGCIAYNAEGKIMTKISKCKDGDSSLNAELLASKEEVLHLALRSGWRRVCLFSDSKVSMRQ